MEFLLTWADRITDGCVAPFVWFPDWFQLVFLSFICAIILLMIFKRVSRQDKIKFHKNKIFGYILETGIFRDQIGRILVNQVSILKHNVFYLRYVAAPFLLLMIPVLFVCVELDSRMGFQPFKNGNQFIIRADLQGTDVSRMADLLYAIECETSDGIVLETPPLRVKQDGGIFWRARVVDDTRENYINLTISGTGDTVKKFVATGAMGGRIALSKTKSGSWKYLLSFCDPPIDGQSAFREIRLNYARSTLPILSIHLTPIVWFFVLTMLFGFLVKPVLKVSF